MPTLVLVTDTNPGVARWEDSSLLGGGCTVIEAGGTIGGTYDCPVLCLGNVTMTADVICRTILVVQGTLFNTAGWNLTVDGDVYGNSLDFTRTNTALPQGNVQIGGSAYFADITFPQYALLQSAFVVQGDLIDRTTFSGSRFDGNGLFQSGTGGASLRVGGDLVFGSVRLSGAESLLAGVPSGNGGELRVNGNMTLAEDLTMMGGDHYNGNDAGMGGSAFIHGRVSVGIEDFWEINVAGGFSDGGNGGDGGTFECWSDVLMCAFTADGGNCGSTNPSHGAGQGGFLNIYGAMTALDDVSLDGGYRFGALTGAFAGKVGNAGSINIRGCATVDADFTMRGGGSDTSGFPSPAGSGGYLDCFSNLVVTDDVRLPGGFANFGASGNGGVVDVSGDVYINDVSDLRGQGGNNDFGGNGGNFFVGGSATLGPTNCSANYTTQGTAGSGGSMYIGGNLTFKGGGNAVDLSGGVCDSTNEAHTSGRGGSIFCKNLTSDCTITLSGGARVGPTTVPTLGLAANAGSITCQGNLVTGFFITAVGGYCQTDYKCQPGGNGGNILVTGIMTTGDGVILSGGASNGLNAGNGGTLEVLGSVSLTSFQSDGGEAFDSLAGGDAGVNGCAGQALFQGGADIRTVTMQAGAGPGSTSGNSVYLNIAGSVNINTLTMSDLPTYYIVAGNSKPCVLKLNVMTAKQTLNSQALATSNNIGAMIADSAFVSDVNSIWYRVQGTSVFGP